MDCINRQYTSFSTNSTRRHQINTYIPLFQQITQLIAFFHGNLSLRCISHQSDFQDWQRHDTRMCSQICDARLRSKEKCRQDASHPSIQWQTLHMNVMLTSKVTMRAIPGMLHRIVYRLVAFTAASPYLNSFSSSDLRGHLVPIIVTLCHSIHYGYQWWSDWSLGLRIRDLNLDLKT